MAGSIGSQGCYLKQYVVKCISMLYNNVKYPMCFTDSCTC